MKIIFYMIFSLAVLLSLLFFNFGKLIDVTEKPVSSDLIICLSGGDIHRLEKSIELYLKGFSHSDTLLFTGDDILTSMKKKGYKDVRIGYMKKYHPEIKFFHNPDFNSTGEEVHFIKQYMKEHTYKSALIVTDPFHSRRVSLLISLISVEDDQDMTFRIIDSDVKYWNKENYYKNREARVFAKQELIKIPYNVIAYGLLDKIGLLDETKKWVEDWKGRE